MNAAATFQRAMDIAFAKEKDNFVVIYTDEITFYSKSGKDYIKHLEKVFLKYRKYGISLNPRNSNFAMKLGKLFSHIISKDGIRIDPDRTNVILKVDKPRNKKETQYFIGQVNLLRRFIPSFAKILRNVTNTLKKDSEIKWTVEAKIYFNDIKKEIKEAHVIVIPHFSKYFMVFSYASEHTIVGVLLQKKQTKC